MYMDGIKLFAKTEKDLETLIYTVSDYTIGQRDRIWHTKMRNVNN